ncbi:MAG: hemolysin family protein [Paenibacillus macerans]|uniref:Transporter associated domain protein n=1 Tax=Paenibacillus macerans TaxID=44252 RepID=A0A090ZEE3_PAEMA|nr:hemolysin family protein [Paenibacillus macerans]KFN08813.1 transporter associated domain protein [Paenibacillus macerans]MCY7560091.1 hemolysin family protein [Paenibacillus macerans]MDU7475340.1 hemolysin family protein [Paenibacillus macerans]MEC0139653.1 hemolysin family protein [Paenibacillus macerans]MEC0150447.1 hemolysin family protein [Paenibacillus macerans]
MSDPLPSLLHVGLMVLLVLLNGFFVSAEFAIVKVRSSRIDAMVEEGRRRAAIVKRHLDHLDGYLSACQVGITLSSLGLGWLGEPVVARLLSPLFELTGLGERPVYLISLTVAFILIAVLHIVLGELSPKTIAVRKAETITLWFAWPMLLFYRIMYPFIWILNHLSSGLLRLFKISPVSGQDSVHTEEEIRVMMKESSESGLIDSTEMSLVDNIFEFADTTAREIMIPRTEMICLYTQHSLEENLEIALEGTRTRYPVCHRDKDHIIGFIHIKDLIRSNTRNLRDLIRPIMAVPESIQISDLMKRMQRGRTQIAILIDEYGGTSGMVTLEDIVEEIVGEIQDEFDEERPGIEQVEPGVYSVDGLMLIESINDRFGLELDSDDYDTIGGWLYSRIEILPPQVGQTVEYGEFVYVVEETDNKRISRVKLIRQQLQPLEEAGA